MRCIVVVDVVGGQRHVKIGPWLAALPEKSLPQAVRICLGRNCALNSGIIGAARGALANRAAALSAVGGPPDRSSSRRNCARRA